MTAPLLRALVAAAAFLALGAAEAAAHGTTLSPASRNYVCRYLDRDSEPCAHAWSTRPQAMYDWMGILIAKADGRHRELIPDGQLCAGGNREFAVFDRPSAKWLATGLTPGRQSFKWVLNAPHATLYYRFYLTEEGFDPAARALRWDDLELIHDSKRREAAKLDRFDVDVPQRTGRHVLYAIWQRSDSPEAFYACSDVVFGAEGDLPADTPLPDEARNQPGSGGKTSGGSGGTGKGGAGPRKLSSKGIRLKRKIDTDWGAGYCATITVTNRSKRTRAWKASMRMPDTITGLWNAKHRVSGKRLRVRGESYNRTLKRGASTTFGFCANR